MSPPADDLRELLSRVRLTLEPSGEGGWVVGYERERHPLPALPLDALDPTARRAELLALAAGIEAAVKFPAPVEDCDFREGAATLLPRVERASFLVGYDAVLAGRGAGDLEGLAHRTLGAGLVVAYVRDAGWRFSYVTRAQTARWDVSPGTIDAGARSHLYHRDEVPWDAERVSLGDGYDATRVVLAGDLFYHHDRGGSGIALAVPGRDLLLVGPAATPDAVAAAFEAAAYPLCPHPLSFARGEVRVAG